MTRRRSICSEISSIILQNTQVYLSAYLLAELAKCKISLVVADEKCNPIGQYLPLYGAHNASKRVAEQLAWGEPIKKRVWQQVVKEKIRQQARVLEEKGQMEAAKALYVCRGEGRVGATRRTGKPMQRAYYFTALFGRDFSRDDNVPVNAALNYGYAVLLSTVNREVVSRGYLTQCGICHRNEYNQFNFSCDLMEPSRPDRRSNWRSITRGSSSTRRFGACSAIWGVASWLTRAALLHRLRWVVSLFVQDCLAALGKNLAASEIEAFRAGMSARERVRHMRVFVFFDLPVETAAQREKTYRLFRKSPCQGRVSHAAGGRCTPSWW